MKACPFCAEEIQDAAIKCKHCGEMLADSAAPKHQETKHQGVQGHNLVPVTAKTSIKKTFSAESRGPKPSGHKERIGIFALAPAVVAAGFAVVIASDRPGGDQTDRAVFACLVALVLTWLGCYFGLLALIPQTEPDKEAPIIPSKLTSASSECPHCARPLRWTNWTWGGHTGKPEQCFVCKNWYTVNQAETEVSKAAVGVAVVSADK